MSTCSARRRQAPRVAGRASAGRSAAACAIYACTGFRALRLVPVGDQEQRLPGRVEGGHELASGRSEHVRVWPERRAALEDRRQASLWVEWNAAILRILRMPTGNRDLVSLPVDVRF